MKKIFLFALMFFSLYFSFTQKTNAKTEPQNYISAETKTKIITQELASDSTADLNNVRLRFCNEMNKNIFTDDLWLKMRPWQKKEICIVLTSKAAMPINVLVGFSEATVDEKWRITCGNDISYTNRFSQNIINGPMTGIIVPASGSTIQRFRYYAPQTSTGDEYGCVVYKINQEEKIATGQMFLVLVRKIAPVYINITGDIYNFWRWDDIKYIYTDNQKIILKIILAILVIRLVITIVKTAKKKSKPTKKK